MRRFFVGVVIFAAVGLIFIPFIIGLVLQKVGARTIFANAKIVNYHRGWFSSDAVLRVKLNDTDLHRIVLQQLGLTQDIFPDAVEFVTHIQHGPVFYQQKNLSHLLGVAASEYVLQLASSQSFFAALGITNENLPLYQSILTFTGQYLVRVELENAFLTLPDVAALRLASLRSNMEFSWLTRRVKGTMSVTALSLNDGMSSIVLPRADVQFDLKPDHNGLWIGSQSLSVSDIIVRDEDSQVFALNSLQLDSLTQETSGLIDANKQISIHALQVNHQRVGPFHLQLSATHLNADAIANLIAAYKDIKQHGELYESQLRQQMLTILPQIISKGASIKLGDLKLVTPNGELKMDAEITWPHEHFAKDNSLADLVQAAKAHSSVRLAKALANDIIDFLAKATFIYQLSPTDRDTLTDTQMQTRLARQQNFYIIKQLMMQGELNRGDGANLLIMIRQRVPMEDYLQQLRELLLTRRISLEKTYFLAWCYAALNAEENFFSIAATKLSKRSC